MNTSLSRRDSRLDDYFVHLKHYPVLTRAEEQALARRVRDHDDKAAAKRLAACNLRFVVKVAHTFRGYGVELPDLVQEGSVGLLVAVARFDPDRGHRFISYAAWWIRAFIWAYVMREASLVRAGTLAQRRLFFKLRSARGALENARGGEVSAADLAKNLDVDIAEIEVALSRFKRDVSLDAPEKERPPSLVAATRMEPTQEQQLGDAQATALRRKWVGGALRQLGGRDRSMIASRYLAAEPETFEHIGRRHRVSRERVRQIHNRALAQMKGWLETAPLEVCGAL